MPAAAVCGKERPKRFPSHAAPEMRITASATSSATASRQALRPEPEYHDIHMPRNSSAGFICAFFAATMGFALIWLMIGQFARQPASPVRATALLDAGGEA